jgi:hypothetical protein
MKLITVLAAALVVGNIVAIAGQANSTAAPPSTSAPAPSTSQAPSSDAAMEPKPTASSCHKQAAAKGLTGSDKTQFMKDCKAGKVSS